MNKFFRKGLAKFIRSNFVYLLIVAIIVYLKYYRKDILPAIKEYNK